MFDGWVDENDGVWKTAHFFDAFEVLLELSKFLAENGDFLLWKFVEGAISFLGL